MNSKDSSISEKYNPSEIESKWQEKWEEKGVYRPDLDKVKRPFYNLLMFPYPSAEGMHVGNMYAFTGADVYGRFKRMLGNDVFEPIGLDGFGIHSENYAIKVGRHPKEQAKISEQNFYRQLRATGNGFDWTRTIETYDADYYRWTQWIFIQLFKKGLAYRKKAPVNFCPKDLTVLADEQVIDGRCERDGAVVEKRELEQWFFKITKYADRLLSNLDNLDWTEKVKIAQREWIGRSEGARIEFKVQSSKFKVDVFTTRQDTLYGATFLVLAPEHAVSASIKDTKVQKYIQEAKKKTEQDRKAKEREKTGVFTGLYAVNPVNNEEIPIWIAEYALMEYGTGALFGDAHDERDVEFAKKYKIPLKPTLITGDKKRDKRILNLEECFTGYGTLINSGPFTGLSSKEAMKKVANWLEKRRVGGPEVTYHLRDWLISRQRYWGPPIPMINCPKCGWQPVLEKDLPVLLPDVKDWKPKGTGKSPLASVESFVNTKCPNCKGAATRETDVSDTFLDSAWYFFRYVSTDIDNTIFDIKTVKKWLPVNMYIGGAEHSVLHLLYARFITMVFKDLSLIDFEEPFKRFYAHGLIIKDGVKMSKSKGNVIVPDQYIAKYGADTVRCYLMFLGPFSRGGDFRDSGIEGMSRFLRRIWSLVIRHLSLAKDQRPKTKDQLRMMHKTIKKVTEDVSSLHYNTAIASLMEYYNFLSKQKEVSKEEIEVYIKLLAPFAPHMTEELFQGVILNEREGSHEILLLRQAQDQNDIGFDSIHLHPWPTFDPQLLTENEVIITVQVNGKMRYLIKTQNSKLKTQNYIEQRARESAKVKKYLEGKSVKKIIYIEGKVINFVVV